MKKISKIVATSLTILVFVTMLVIGTTANSTKPLGFYDPALDGIVSQYYHIDREKGFIMGIAPGTTAEELLKVCLPGNAVISQQQLATGVTISTGVPFLGSEVMPADEVETTQGGIEPTTEETEPTTEEPGSTTEPTTEETEPTTQPTEPDTDTYTLTVIVTGDLNGDGKVTITDMLRIKSSLLGETLPATAKAAGDVNYDGAVTITDFLQVKAVLLGMSDIVAGRPATANAENNLILMTPNTQHPWTPAITEETLTYISYDPTVATADENGVIHALEKEGSTMIYGLNEEGQIVAETMVTVLQEELTISFRETQQKMLTQQTGQLTPLFNHPLRPQVTWESSDSTIVSVDANGVLTAHAMGTAVIKASLENGACAEVTITVAPPITSLQIERLMYKVKPGNTKVIGLITDPIDSEEEILWTSADPSIATVSSDGIVTGVDYGTTTITAIGKYSGLTATCKVKVCNVKQVAITFDDGPSNQTKQLLDFLKENDIRVTFFLVGNRISSYSNTVKREAAEGHEIGYHSYSHQMQTSLTSDKITSDFVKANNTLKSLTGQGFTVWRTPGGEYSGRVLSAVPLPHIMWSVDTLDWKNRNATAVYNKIVNNAKDGSIVLMHDLYATTVTGAINAMRDMLAGDYEFVTVTELLSRNGNDPVNGKTYFSGPSN